MIQDGEASEVFVIFGKALFSPTFNLGSINGINGIHVKGATSNNIGTFSMFALDYNSDGKDDLAIGSIPEKITIFY
jgi:hypothetical protein